MKPKNVLNLMIVGLIFNVFAMVFNAYGFYQEGNTGLFVVFLVLSVLIVAAIVMAFWMRARMIHRQN